ncbi:MAG: hypothetical protein D6732_11265 [Methanobacteriota archaeon]|nr:MAG: hypothetical protein D6732_11265 [Euryarchaeota archaeon]
MSDDVERAVTLIAEGKLKRITGYGVDLWQVTGSHWDYLVVNPDFCTCEHFIIRCTKEPGSVCYHLLAVGMADREKVPEIRLELDDVVHLLWKTAP